MSGRVYVVDDDVSFRTAIERRLKLAGYLVAVFPSAQQLLDQLPIETESGCILLDVQIPGLSGPELQGQLNTLGSTLPIIFLTGHVDTATTVQTIKAGAEDFFTKPIDSNLLIAAIERALARHATARCEGEKKLKLQTLMADLTPRELQVFRLVVLGKLNKQIAYELGTTERTIKAHRHQVMEKMKVSSLAHLVKLADRLGLLI